MPWKEGDFGIPYWEDEIDYANRPDLAPPNSTWDPSTDPNAMPGAGNWVSQPRSNSTPATPTDPPPPPPPPPGAPQPTSTTNPPPSSGGPSMTLGPMLQPYTGQFNRPQFGVAAKQFSDLMGPAPEFAAPSLPTIQPFAHEAFAEPEPFSYEAYQEPEPFAYEAFAEPEPFAYDAYTPTTGADVFSDPSFGMRKDIGEQALMNSRAAQGLLRTGGTLKDLLDYNQNFASQEFGNVDARRFRDHGARRGAALEDYTTNLQNKFQTYGTNRGNAFENYQTNAQNKLQAYGTNRGNAFENYQTNLQNKMGAYGLNRSNAFDTWSANKDTSLGLYDRGFEAERAKFEPKLFEWNTKGQLGARAEENAYDNSFKEFQTDYGMWRNQQNDVFDRLKWSSEFGLDAATR